MKRLTTTLVAIVAAFGLATPLGSSRAPFPQTRGAERLVPGVATWSERRLPARVDASFSVLG